MAFNINFYMQFLPFSLESFFFHKTSYFHWMTVESIRKTNIMPCVTMRKLIAKGDEQFSHVTKLIEQGPATNAS